MPARVNPNLRRKDEGDLIIRHIPRAVRNLFKAYCARRNKSMTDYLRCHMKEVAQLELKVRKNESQPTADEEDE